MLFVSATLLLGAAAAFGGAPKVIADSRVVLVVDGHENVPGAVWHGVKTTVTAVFDRIGIHIIWQTGDSPVSQSPDGVAIAVHLAARLPGALQEEAPTCESARAFACSWPYDSGHSGRMVVMYERVRSISGRPRLFQALLAHLIAHEVAHDLEIGETHSDSGIMKAHWTSSDLEQMESSPLGFTDRDVELIWGGLDHRHRIGGGRN